METKRIGNWIVVSQHPNVRRGAKKRYAESHYLPELIRAAEHIEQTTGYRWRTTSYWRRSPSHQHGVALDIAPDIAKSAAAEYSVFNGSDPVLYKREKLLRDLQQAARTFTPGPYQVNVFIEPDHLHMQVMNRDPGDELPMRIIKWKVAKPMYKDTYSRMSMPLIR